MGDQALAGQPLRYVDSKTIFTQLDLIIQVNVLLARRVFRCSVDVLLHSNKFEVRNKKLYQKNSWKEE